MSVAWFITTYPYEEWDSFSNNILLDTERFFEALQNHFEMKIIKQPNEEGDISWDLYTLDQQSIGFWGLILRDGQGVSFHNPSKDIFIEFALWFRRFVPEHITLYLWNDFDPKQNLALTSQTTTSEISSFMG